MTPSVRDSWQRLEFSRQYTLNLLESLQPDDWYRSTPENVTHIAWQVGHIAWAEARLLLVRVLGIEASEDIIPASWTDLYGKGSTPVIGPGTQPSREQLLGVLNTVHDCVRNALESFDDSRLTEPTGIQHVFFSTRGEALEWASRHELIHAGQIALLRRQLGYTWLR